MCFTPDSKYVIYSKVSDPAEFHSINLYRIPVDGSEPEQLAFFN